MRQARKEMQMMRKAIEKWGMELATKQNGEIGIRVNKAKTAKQIEIVKKVIDKFGKENVINELKVIKSKKKVAADIRWKASEPQRLAAQAQREVEKAADQVLVDEMNAKAQELRNQIPAGHLEVTATIVGDFDGYPQIEYTVENVKINWQDVNVIGWASAVRPGAMGSFAKVCIASISAERLEEIKVKAVQKAAEVASIVVAKEAEISAKFAEAKATGKPVLVHKWSEDCNDPSEECNVDYLCEYAMPDGTYKTERYHTW